MQKNIVQRIVSLPVVCGLALLALAASAPAQTRVVVHGGVSSRYYGPPPPRYYGPPPPRYYAPAPHYGVAGVYYPPASFHALFVVGVPPPIGVIAVAPIPAAYVATAPPPPPPNLVWVEGAYLRDAGAYVWIPGHWVPSRP